MADNELPRWTNEEQIKYFGSEPDMVKRFFKGVASLKEERSRLIAMGEAASSGNEVKSSPTARAREDLESQYREEAEEIVSSAIESVFEYMHSDTGSATAIAAILREYADHFQYVGDLSVQYLRNSKYATSGSANDDVQDQRELVSKLIQTVKVLQPTVAQWSDEKTAKKIVETEIPTLQGIKIGLDSTGTRFSQKKYPVIEYETVITVDGNKLPTGTNLPNAVINHLFPMMGIHSYGWEVKDVVTLLASENEKWDKPGNDTEVHISTPTAVISFRVQVLKKKNEQ